MRSIAFALFICTAAQALPSTLQIYAPLREAPSTISVSDASELQSALDRAKPGDVITLPAGASFTGNFVLPRKSGNRYITLRTGRTDGLPEAGVRVTPNHSGKLARIQSPNSDPVIRTAPGAHHWRLTLLEFGPNARGAGDIVQLGDGSNAQSAADQAAHDLVIDRCYIHGDPAQGQKRGIALNSASTSIVNSYISDIKAVQDAQAIAGWNGPGPFRIENNYLEASGENFLLGGAPPGTPGLVPSDVVFRRNHVTRPASWKSERWTVKNLFELKNGRRVLVEGNLFENNWVDGQPGYAIVLTPSREGGRAPWATVEDVTFRYNIIRNTAAGFNLAARDDGDDGRTMRRVRIADNLIYGVDREAWGSGNGLFLQVGGGPAELIVEHNTVLQGGNIITAYGGTRQAPTAGERFVFRNNITRHNANGVIGQGLRAGNDSLAAFFPEAVFTRNVLAGGRESRYPGDNLFPDMDGFAKQFIDYAGHDYRLRPGSDFRRAATDGANLGVNFVAMVRTMGEQARQWLGLSAQAVTER